MSIVRVGMSEDNKFGDGYDAIFGNKSKKAATKAPAKKPAQAAKKPAKKPKKK